MQREAARRPYAWLWTALVLAAACALWAPSYAAAVTEPKVTMNVDTGGLPTRFTVVAVTDEDTTTVAADLVFPEGFDVRKSTVVVDILRGIQITHVPITSSVQGTSVKTVFGKPVPPKSQLRVLIYDVVTRDTGGTFELGFRYTTGGGQARSAKGFTFDYLTPPASERIERWLDRQPLVQRWTGNKFLSIFLSPRYAVEGLFLGFAGWLVSLGLVGVAFPVAIAGGLLLAFCKMSKIAPLRWVASIYVNVIRGTPLFLQIMIAFVGLPIAIGTHFNWFPLGVTVLALNSSAYLTEIFRAGIQSINKGQIEAASSLGMTYFQAMRYVIVPQTVKRVLPTMTSEFILLFKDTSLLFPVGVFELLLLENSIVARSANLTPFVVAACYYLVVTIPLINWVGHLEHRLAISEGAQGVVPKKRNALDGMTRTVDPLSTESPLPSIGADKPQE